VHDHDWAGRVVGALLADRAEQEATEAAVAARADNEQIGAARFVDETRSRRTLDDAALDLDIIELSSHLASHVLEQFLCRPMDSANVAPLQRTVRTEGADGVDDAQRRLPQPRLLEREPQRRLGSGRVVDADDDYAYDSLL
jgi:hypothetical protein